MAHAGGKKEPAPGANLFRTAVRFRHALVIVDGVERREPRITHAMPENQLAAVSGERIEIGPTPRLRDGRGGIGSGAFDRAIDIHSDIRERRTDRISTAIQQAWNALRRDDSGVEREARINLSSFRILRSGKCFFEGGGLRSRKTAVRFRAAANQRFWIKAARLKVEHHAVLHAVGRVAVAKQAVDDS